MLKSENRLPKGVRLLTPRTFKTEHFLIKKAQNSLGACRIAISVSKKIDKRAVGRNRIKRQISACLEKKISTLPSVDFLFIVKKPIQQEAQLICQELENIITSLL